MQAVGIAPEIREAAREMVEAFHRNGLTYFAAAVSFRALLAVLPFLLFVLALLGFLELTEVWRDDIAPEVKDSVSRSAFTLIDDTVTNVLTRKQLWWLTAGLALTLWEASSAMRVTMVALDRIYGLRRRRRFLELLPRSVALGIAVGGCLLGAVVIVRFGPLLVGQGSAVLAVASFVVRWLLATALFGVAVGLVVRYGTATRQPLPWVSLGGVLVTVGWAGMTFLFGLYVTYVANYGSVFGHLATIFVLFLYVYASAIVFLAGAQLDASIRAAAEE
jgi:membrane protein